MMIFRLRTFSLIRTEHNNQSKTFIQMKQILTFLLFLLIGLQSQSQDFAVGHLQQTFIDPARSNREIPCEVYYPAAVAGDDTEIATGVFPVLVFGHGFVMEWSAYDIYWQTLVPEGYIMVWPLTEGTLAPSHGEFGKDLAFLCEAMQQEGADSSSPFFGAVDVTSAVMGHSMGGGCAFLALQENPSITALAVMAPAVTNPSSVDAAAAVNKPGIVFAGNNDCVTPPEDHQIPMYDAFAADCKSYIGIEGANHCQFASYNFNCTFGQSFCSPQATISAEEQQSVLFTCLMPWLDFYLKNDCAAGDVFQGLMESPDGFTAEQNCTLECLTNNVDPQSGATYYRLYPNPCANYLFFETSENEIGLSYQIENVCGQVTVQSVIQSKVTSIDLTSQQDGLYFFRLSNGRSFRFIIQN